MYDIAYIADSSQYDQYLPIAQQMIDSFEIGTSSDINARQFDSSDQSQSPPELMPKTPFGNNEEESQAAETNRFAAMIEFEPSNQYEDYYDVSNFAFAVAPVELYYKKL